MPPCTSSGGSPPVTGSTGPADVVAAAGPTIVFCRTKHGADRIARQLEQRGIRAAAIHGDRSQKQREKALDLFVRGAVDALVATDVAARGIHVDGVNAVVHFDPPADAKDYVHRSGRTARAGADRGGRQLRDPGQGGAVKRLQRDLGVPVGTTPPGSGRHHRRGRSAQPDPQAAGLSAGRRPRRSVAVRPGVGRSDAAAPAGEIVGGPDPSRTAVPRPTAAGSAPVSADRARTGAQGRPGKPGKPAASSKPGRPAATPAADRRVSTHGRPAPAAR